MTPSVLFASIDTSGYQPGNSLPPFVDYQDFYAIDTLDLTAYTGVYLAGWCDQLYLQTCYDQLSDFVRQGGRLMVNGHPLTRFVEGLPEHRSYDFHGMNDLTLHHLGDHPIWEGVDRQDLWLKTGVPGNHSIEELKTIGVAGFYARSYLTNLPEGARALTGMGPFRLPVDIVYPLGKGEVVVHNGLELPIFVYPDKSTANLAANMFTWLRGGNA